MEKVDENNQEANATLDWQQNQDANANPNDADVNLEEMTQEELLAHAQKLKNEYKEYRKNSEKGVQKLNQKLKEQTDWSEARAREIAQEELDKVHITRTLNSVKNQLTEKQREAFDTEYGFLTDGRKIDSNSVDTYVRKALDLIGSKKQADIVWISLGASNKSESSSKAKAEQRKENAKAFVEEMWL